MSSEAMHGLQGGACAPGSLPPPPPPPRLPLLCRWKAADSSEDSAVLAPDPFSFLLFTFSPPDFLVLEI